MGHQMPIGTTPQTFAALAIALTLAGHAADAQTIDDVRIGARVRVYQMIAGERREVTGVLVSRDCDSIGLRPERSATAPTRIAVRDTYLMEFSRERHTGAAAGAWIGLVGGFVVGYFTSNTTAKCQCGEPGVVGLFAGGVVGAFGAGVGGLLGATMTFDRWTAVARSSPVQRSQVGRPGGFRLGLSIPF